LTVRKKIETDLNFYNGHFKGNIVAHRRGEFPAFFNSFDGAVIRTHTERFYNFPIKGLTAKVETANHLVIRLNVYYTSFGKNEAMGNYKVRFTPVLRNFPIA